MTMNYDHLPGATGFMAVCAHELTANVLPERAEIKAVKMKSKDTVGVYVFCDPAIDEEQMGYVISYLRQRFSEAFKEVYHFTMRRKFVVYYSRTALEKLLKDWESSAIDRLTKTLTHR